MLIKQNRHDVRGWINWLYGVVILVQEVDSRSDGQEISRFL
jgi:hypothetical protein